MAVWKGIQLRNSMQLPHRKDIAATVALCSDKIKKWMKTFEFG